MTLHTMNHILTLQPGQMTLADLRTVWQQPVRVQLSDDAQAGIAASAAAIHAIVQKGDAAYGINTGFGKLAKTRIPDEQLELLQRNLIRKMLEAQIKLPDAIWGRLNLAWAGFFIAMGLLNLYVAYNFSEEAWVNFKMFGGMGLMLAFVLAQGFYLSRHMEEETH